MAFDVSRQMAYHRHLYSRAGLTKLEGAAANPKIAVVPHESVPSTDQKWRGWL